MFWRWCSVALQSSSPTHLQTYFPLFVTMENYTGKLWITIFPHSFPPLSPRVPIWRRINVPLTIWRWFVAQVTDVRHLIDQSVFTSVLVVFGYTCDIAFNLITVDSYWRLNQWFPTVKWQAVKWWTRVAPINWWNRF